MLDAMSVAQWVPTEMVAYEPCFPAQWTSLSEAVLRAAEGEPFARIVCTADEALVVPEHLDAGERLAALRAFVARLPRIPLAVYGFAAAHRVVVRGDVPAAGTLLKAERIVNTLALDAIHVVDLGCHAVATCAVKEVLTLSAPPRMATAMTFAEDSFSVGFHRLHVAIGRYACADLRFASSHASGLCAGAADTPRGARDIALAEGAERFASGDIAALQVHRGRHIDLDHAIPLTDVVCYTDRQYAAGHIRPWTADTECGWIQGKARDLSTLAVPAAIVLYPYVDDPGLVAFTAANSSGTAAGETLEQATEAAAFEAIERDAFMWTWINQVAREHLHPEGLPDASTAWCNELRREGWTIHLVNLTLDLLPVVLAVARTERTLLLGAACRPTGAAAAHAAVREVAVASLHVPEARAIEPEAVATTDDHQALYIDSDHVTEASFLWNSSDIVEVDELSAGCADSPLTLLAERIAEPVTVDLTSARTRPVHVVRVIVPGLIPMSFGYDGEPLGIPRLSQGLVRGHSVGSMDGPLLPHPFS